METRETNLLCAKGTKRTLYCKKLRHQIDEGRIRTNMIFKTKKKENTDPNLKY